MSRWSNDVIEYTNVSAIREALVGRSIVSVHADGEPTDYDRVITFTLDDGTQFRAHAADGGCGCSNGCFSVDTAIESFGTIMAVELEEVVSDWDHGDRVVKPGSVSDGSAVIRLFIYGDLGKATLVESEGGDNGYYGWGFWISIHPAGE